MEGESELAKKVKKLIDKRGDLLARAVAQTMQRYNENPTVANLKAMEASKKIFEQHGAQAQTQDSPVERRFANLTEVLDYLKQSGYKIQKSKLYADKRIINQGPDGSYTQKAADDYARLCLPPLDGSNDSLLEPAKRKVDLEISLLEERHREARRENEIKEGRWVLKSDAEQKHAVKLALLLMATDNFIAGHKIEELIEIVKGDREAAQEFRFFLRHEFRAMLFEYAKAPEFAVPVKAMDEAEEFKLSAAD